MRKTITLAGTIIFGLTVFGCSDSGGPNNSDGTQRVGLMVTTLPNGVSGAPALAGPDSVKVGGHTLVLDKVELVLREIELKRVARTGDCTFDSSPSAASQNGESKSGDGHKGDRDHRQGHECSEMEIGPFLIDLPLGAGPTRKLQVQVDTGNFREIEFKIHKVGSDTGDAKFLAAHPAFVGTSIRAVGRFDGKAFTYTSDVSAKQETDLDPPLVVKDATITDLTLVVEVGSWFLSGGVGLIDPSTAKPGTPTDAVVRQNIRRSFRIFEDRDHDGRKDR